MFQPSQELWHAVALTSFDVWLCELLKVPPRCWSGADAASTTVPLQGLADAVGQLGVEGQAAVVAAAGALFSQHHWAVGVGQTMVSLKHTHQPSSIVISCHQSSSIIINPKPAKLLWTNYIVKLVRIDLRDALQGGESWRSQRMIAEMPRTSMVAV